jgi:hypothetical protein
MITQKLIALADASYRDFTATLIPTVDKARIIGVRTPAMRSLAKELLKNESEKAMAFLEELPHYYYEENNLHSFIIAELKDFEQVIKYTERFLPYIDNWATCDTFAPKIFLKYPEETLVYVQKWLASADTYTVRYGIGILLSNYLDAHFNPVHLQWVTAIQSDEYYINMMIAWYLATALAKQYEATLPYLEAKTLAPFAQNKSIQKARESKRITPEIKEYLLTLKVQKS